MQRHEHRHECTINVTRLYINLEKTLHETVFFICTTEDRGKTNTLRNGVH